MEISILYISILYSFRVRITRVRHPRAWAEHDLDLPIEKGTEARDEPVDDESVALKGKAALRTLHGFDRRDPGLVVSFGECWSQELAYFVPNGDS